MRIDVIVVTWNSGDRVIGCLERLASQETPHERLVVDNGSRDGTAARVRDRDPDARVLALEHNVGFGAAVNAGVAAAAGDLIVLVNDDVQVEPGFLAAMVAPLQADPACGMVAGLMMLPGSELVDGLGIELDVTLAAYNRLRREPPGAASGRLAMPSGGAAAYRRSAFERAGGFDERLFAYGEDVDLGLRMRRDGWSAAEAPDARGVHLGGATVGVDSPLQRELAGFSRGFVLARYGVLRGPSAVRAILLEAAVIAWGLARYRTTVPLRARVRGYRAAGPERLAVPEGVIETSITMREAFRRLRQAR